MTKRVLSCVAFALIVPLSGCWAAEFGESVHESFHQTIAHPPSSMSLNNSVGAIRIDAWNRPTIQIDAVKSANSTDALKKMRIAVEQQPDRIAISTEYESNGPHGGGVKYTIHVPVKTNLDVTSAVGSVEIDGVASNVKVESATGKVSVAMAKLGSGQSLDVNNSVGEVVLAIPKGSDASIHAGTAVGGIQSDFPMNVQRQGVGAQADFKVGQGAADVRLSTSTGGIRIASP